MSEPLRIALVAEGPTDAVVIDAALRAMLPERPFVLKQVFPVLAQVMGKLSPIGTRSATPRSAIQKSKLQCLEPAIITEHLKAAHWTLIGYWEGNKASVWSMGEERVVVPSSQHFGDYAQRVSEVIEILSQVEGRTLDEVWHDLADAKATTID